MAYSEALAARIRRLLGRHADTGEKKMFGGLCFLAAGRMVCGVMADALIARVDAAEMDALLKTPGVRPMTFTGRAMRGFVVVAGSAIARDDDLLAWIERGRAVAAAMPAKATAKRAPHRRR